VNPIKTRGAVALRVGGTNASARQKLNPTVRTFAQRLQHFQIACPPAGEYALKTRVDCVFQRRQRIGKFVEHPVQNTGDRKRLHHLVHALNVPISLLVERAKNHKISPGFHHGHRVSLQLQPSGPIVRKRPRHRPGHGPQNSVVAHPSRAHIGWIRRGSTG
jgi:hypothetical protein